MRGGRGLVAFFEPIASHGTGETEAAKQRRAVAGWDGTGGLILQRYLV